MTEEEFQTQEAEEEQKKAERSRNAANNAQALRTAAKVAEKTSIAPVAAAGAAVNAADKITGGASTEMLGHAMNAVTPRSLQNAINTSAESGALDAANAALLADSNNTTGNTTSQNNASNNTNSEENNIQETEKKNNLGLIIVVTIIVFFMLIIMPIVLAIGAIMTPFIMFSPGDKMSDLSTIVITNSKTSDGEIDFEDYIAGIVAADTTYVNDLEYYKYEAINTRTKFLATATNNEVDATDENFKYIDVDESPYSEVIKQAVEETAGLVITKEELMNYETVTSKVVDSNETNYIVEYSTESSETKTQTISKDWEHIATFSSYLDNSYLQKEDNSYDLTKILEAYLITYENKSYEDTIKTYYEDISIVDANTITTGTLVNGFITPVKNFSCSNGYGCRFHPIHKAYKLHNGVDLGASSGEPVYAAKTGTITQVTTNVIGTNPKQGYGNYITIEHDDGSQTRYAHLLYQSIPSSIFIGARVQQGQMIGKVGSTGASTGPHLHYEIFVNGSRVNPYNYMDLSNASNNAEKCNSNASTPMSYCGF